jgi:TPR repeat protein
MKTIKALIKKNLYFGILQMKTILKSLFLITTLSTAAGCSESKFEVTKTRAEAGDVNAQELLGYLYINGDGTEINEQEGLRWLKLAGGNDALIRILETNIQQRIEPDVVHKLRSDASLGLAEAQFSLGELYRKGSGVAQSYWEAFKFYKLAAEQGYGEAQYSLGSMYVKGDGIAQDYSEAMRWYRLAADQGVLYAYTELGRIYRLGLGVPVNYRVAADWYKLAANNGEYFSQDILGRMYEIGQGVEQSNFKAYIWYSVARASNYPSEIESVQKALSPQELEQAQAQATRCFESNYQDCD